MISKQVVKTLEIGSRMPAFKLIGANDEYFDSKKLAKANAILIVFLSNYCATSQGYEQRIMDISEDYREQGLRVVTISPNSPLAISLEEMGYSDLDDSFASMRLRSRNQHFDFPYLYDGDDHQVSLKFGPRALPHAFLFDDNQVLRYRGNIDGGERPGTAQGQRLRNAINAVLEDREIIRAAVDAYGCQVKWSWMHQEKTESDSLWSARPVGLQKFTMDSLKTIMVNFGPRVRLINFWATWCGPCKIEFPELVKMQRMYGERRFEFISVSLDTQPDFDKALTFLKHVNSSLANYMCPELSHAKAASRIHPDWDGTLPCTIILEPYGEVYRFWQGPIDPVEVKKAIVEHRLLGRYH